MLESGQTLVCVPGTGGAEFYFYNVIKKGVILCGLQRVHCIARLKEYGSSVYALGRKPSITIATIPSRERHRVSKEIFGLLNIECEELPNYCAVTLTPSNSVLHTSRLYSMFNDYFLGKVYDHNILFYEEWNDNASEILFKCDEEVQNVCKAFDDLDLKGVKSLKDHYESYSIEAMTRKISTIPAFKGLNSPMKHISSGWIPDFSSRYFTADFPYGLKIIIEIAHAKKVCVTEMEKIWKWYTETNNLYSGECFTLENADIDEIYNR